MQDREHENIKAEEITERDELSNPGDVARTSELDELRARLTEAESERAQLEARIQEAEVRHLRLRAEFDNFRRRSRQEADDVRARAAEGLASSLLPVVDNLERAVAAGAGPGRDPKAFADGVQLVLRQFLQELEKVGVRPIEATGNPFDPNFHEAVAYEESDESAEGTIIEEFQRGYVLNDKVLRPSMVKVAKARSAVGGEDQ